MNFTTRTARIAASTLVNCSGFACTKMLAISPPGDVTPATESFQPADMKLRRLIVDRCATMTPGVV